MVPLVAPNGQVLGSFCVVDVRPRAWTERDVEVLRTLAGAAAREIALRETDGVSKARRDLAFFGAEAVRAVIASQDPSADSANNSATRVTRPGNDSSVQTPVEPIVAATR